MSPTLPLSFCLSLAVTVGSAGITLEPLWSGQADSYGVAGVKVDRPASTRGGTFNTAEDCIASVAKGDGTVRLWNAESGKELWDVRIGPEIEAVAFTREGRYVITAGENPKTELSVLIAADGSLLRNFDEPAGVLCLRPSPDGKRVATGDSAGFVRLRDLADEDPLRWPFSPVTAVVHGPDSDAPGGGKGQGDVHQLDWSSDGKFLFSAGANGVIRQWESAKMALPETGLVRSFRGHKQAVKCLRVSPNDQLIASVSEGTGKTKPAKVMVHEIGTGKIRLEHSLNVPRVTGAVAFSPDGEWLLAGGSPETGGPDGLITIWQVSRLLAGKTEPLKTVPMYDLEAFFFKRDGSRLVTCHRDGSLRVWKVGK